MLNDISCGTKDNEEECLAHAKVVSLCARRFGTGQWSVIGPSSEKKSYSVTVHKESGTISRRRCCWNSPTVEVRFSVLRLRGPEVKSKAKDMIHFAATQETIETIFPFMVSASQFSLYGAVSEMCEEYESRHDRSEIQSCSVRSRLKFLWIVMTQRIKIFYFNKIENELKNVTTR